MQQRACKPTSSPRRHTRARVPPTGPYAANRSTPANNALTVYTGSTSLRTGRVPGQPGLARPPAPQDHMKTIPQDPEHQHPKSAWRVTREPAHRTTSNENYPQLVPDSPSSQQHTYPEP